MRERKELKKKQVMSEQGGAEAHKLQQIMCWIIYNLVYVFVGHEDVIIRIQRIVWLFQRASCSQNPQWICPVIKPHHVLKWKPPHGSVIGHSSHLCEWGFHKSVLKNYDCIKWNHSVTKCLLIHILCEMQHHHRMYLYLLKYFTFILLQLSFTFCDWGHCSIQGNINK